MGIELRAQLLSVDPQAGREHAGRRPALVLSGQGYNRKVGLVVVCPVTSKVKGYPFKVQLPPNLNVSGVALADQLRSLDWRAQLAEHACDAGEEVASEAVAKFKALVEG